jgi:hypothetical protein
MEDEINFSVNNKNNVLPSSVGLAYYTSIMNEPLK